MPVSDTLDKEKIINMIPSDKAVYWSCWSLETSRGRQVWRFQLPESLKPIIVTETDWQKPEGQDFLLKMRQAFVYDKTHQAHSADLPYRTFSLNHKKFVPLEEKSSPGSLKEQVLTATKKGFHLYEGLQTEGGNWPGDYGGPLFLQPGMVIVAHLTKNHIPEPYASLSKQYMLNMQNEDGGWGLHIEGPSTMLGTVLQYVALRLLGENKNDPKIVKARKWIHENGGANFIPSWGKFYLSVLGVYEWKGYNSILPEIWRFPKWLPFHPSRYWCHARMVHMPMAYCYANKLKGEETE